MKKIFLVLFCLIAVCLVIFLIFAPGIVAQRMNPVAPHQAYKVSATTKALHQSLQIMDWHADSLLWKRDLLQRGDKDHVALGFDYDGAVGVSFDTSELAGLTQALLDQGLSEHVVAKVVSGNSVRFLLENLP